MSSLALHSSGVTPRLEEKVAHLSRIESYGEGATAVEIIETHMSVVFLTDQYVYKLKKPVRYPFLDFSTLEARRFNCEEEVRLNQRLARNVYLGVVPLAITHSSLELAGHGEPVDWLVKMRRLPRHLMLDRALSERRVSESEIARFTRVLSRFYQDAERIPLEPEQYRERLVRQLFDNQRALSKDTYGLDLAQLEGVASRQKAFIHDHGAVIAERVQRRLIVEAHGDLRPEHVCLAAEPVFIDCLEFSRDLRILDPVDELGYLAMECAVSGAPYVGDVVFETYRARTGDSADPHLIRFYQASRALLRAKLAAWH
ncbi:MAG: hypothetical protein ACXWCS_22725, partial [Burkholderiales bacterium]